MSFLLSFLRFTSKKRKKKQKKYCQNEQIFLNGTYWKIVFVQTSDCCAAQPIFETEKKFIRQSRSEKTNSSIRISCHRDKKKKKKQLIARAPTVARVKIEKNYPKRAVWALHRLLKKKKKFLLRTKVAPLKYRLVLRTRWNTRRIKQTV